MADDFLTKKKENGPILDLSQAVCNSKEDLQKLLEKIPDFKIRPVKVKPEEIKIKDKDFKFKTTKKDMKITKETYNFMNPIPVEMRDVKFDDIVAIPIDWRMLTTLRPKTRQDEEYFSRLVELGKSQLKTRQQERRTLTSEPLIRKTKNKNGVVEMRIATCSKCKEEFCDGKTCDLFSYDSFARVTTEQKTTTIVDPSQTSEKIKKKKIKRRSRSKSKSKGKGRRKSKSKSKSPAKSKSPSKNSSRKK